MSEKKKQTKNKPKKSNEPVLFETSYMQSSQGKPYIYLIILMLAVIVVFGKKFIAARNVPVGVAQDQPVQSDESQTQKNR